MNAQYEIQIETDDVEGHRIRIGFAPDDPGWLDSHLGGEGERVRLSLVDDDDTDGHLRAATVRVRLTDDQDDTEGHAISLQFPSVQEADAFRRRLIASGLITATIALGAVGGMAVGQQLSTADAESVTANQAWQEASASTADRQAAPLSAGQAYSEAAANEAARQGAGAEAAAAVQEAYAESAANEAARQGGGSMSGVADDGKGEKSGLTPR